MAILKAKKWLLNGVTPGPSKSLSHTLLISNGFIHPVGKGLYSILPLGQRVIDRIVRILDEEFQKIGCLKMTMPIVAPQSLWDKTGRWKDMGAEMMRLEDRAKASYCLQPTAEEMTTDVIAALSPLKKHLFPLMVYQISEKFRDEMNPRFGLYRSRQFLMKDLYSFDISQEESRKTYEAVTQVYDRIFTDVLKLDVFKALADSGVHGGTMSHEYHLKSSLQEDSIDFCSKCKIASKMGFECGCDKKSIEKLDTVEVGHTFHLGTRYSQAFNADFNGTPLDMCCFGIGVTRLLPAVVDSLTVSADVMRFPRAIAPVEAVVIVKKSLMSNVVLQMTLSAASQYLKGGVMLDDRTELSVGRRMRDANRIGAPFVVVLANETERSLVEGPKVEVFTTEAHSKELISNGLQSLDQFVNFIQ